MRRWWLVCVLASACATAPLTEDRYRALSPGSQALFDKYHQFMTDEQTEAFFSAHDEVARQQLIDDLHVEERLARYPRFIQDAIWERVPVVGMDRNAVFLSLGRPDAVDRENVDPDTHELPRETWRYRRGPRVNQDYLLTMVNDQVIDVRAPELK